MKKVEERFLNPIDIISDVSPKEFKEKYLKADKPAIIRGLWRDYPAQEKWTVDYFKKELGDLEVGVFNGKMQKNDRSFKKPHEHMLFGKYLDHIDSNEQKDLRLFLFNILKHKPDLKNDYKFPPLTNRYLKRFSFMFFGLKGSKVRIHQDMDWSNVFLTQLHGVKEVYLFHPKYSTLLYRMPFGVHSQVDVENPDYEKYPGLKHVEGYYCKMNPGDTLFIPSGYWHYIKYADGGYAINQRAMHRKTSVWLRGLYYVAILSQLDELMLKLMGSRWFAYKERRSVERAERELQKLKATA